MKLARYTVKLPIDDTLLVDDVRFHLAKTLEGLGTEILEVPMRAIAGEPGEAVLPGTPPPKGRIHWPAVEVVHYAGERAVVPAVKNGSRRK